MTPTVQFYAAFDDLRAFAQPEEACGLVSALILLHVTDQFREVFEPRGFTIAPDHLEALYHFELSEHQVFERVRETLTPLRISLADEPMRSSRLNQAPADIARASRTIAQLVRRAADETASLQSLLLLGEAYTEFLQQVSLGAGLGGLLLTPASLAQLETELLDVQPGMRVLDFAVGPAHTFVVMARYIRRQGFDPNDITFVGQDVNSPALFLAAVHLLLNGVFSFDLRHGNALTEPLEQHGQFDRVVSDPPFGVRLNETYHLERDPRFGFGVGGKLPRTADLLFLQHGLTALRPGGRAIFVTSNGALFRSGLEGKIRQDILAAGWLNTVIALPSALYVNINISVAMTVFDRPGDVQKRHTDVLMLDATFLGTRERRLQILGTKAREQLVDLFRRRQDELEVSSVVPNTTVHENSDSWQPNQYVARHEVQGRTLHDIRADTEQAMARVNRAEAELAAALADLAPLDPQLLSPDPKEPS